MPQKNKVKGCRSSAHVCCCGEYKVPLPVGHHQVQQEAARKVAFARLRKNNKETPRCDATWVGERVG